MRPTYKQFKIRRSLIIKKGEALWPNMMNDINQPDDDKAAKHASIVPFELNAAHRKNSHNQQIASLSQQIQAKLAPVQDVVNNNDRETLAKLDKEFSNLIREVNILREEFKKINAYTKIDYQVLYENACKRVPGVLEVNPKINKKFFYALSEGLDNTHIIDAYPHGQPYLRSLFYISFFLIRILHLS